MNRCTFIEILKQSYLLFIQDNLNRESYGKMLKKIKSVSYDETLSFLNLRELLIMIYDNTAYYDVPYILPKFRMHLYDIIEKCKDISSEEQIIFKSLGMIDTLLKDIFKQLKSRVEIEASAHMSHLINNYYYYSSDNFNNDVLFLNHNIYSGAQVFGTQTVVTKYQQPSIYVDNIYLTENISIVTDIRDLASEENYNLSSEWNKYLKDSVKRSLNKDNKNHFREYFNAIVKKTNNPKRINKLFNKQYSLILNYLENNQRKWEKNDQIILAFIQNMKKDSNN